MLTSLTPTAELAAAHAATRPFANEEEIRPVSWRPAGSRGEIFYSCTIIFWNMTHEVYSYFFTGKRKLTLKQRFYNYFTASSFYFLNIYFIIIEKFSLPSLFCRAVVLDQYTW